METISPRATCVFFVSADVQIPISVSGDAPIFLDGKTVALNWMGGSLSTARLYSYIRRGEWLVSLEGKESSMYGYGLTLGGGGPSPRGFASW